MKLFAIMKKNKVPLIANPHTFILEDGGMKSVNLEQLQFKELVDPLGFAEQGKMRAWLERD
jgi:hypothetical protein